MNEMIDHEQPVLPGDEQEYRNNYFQKIEVLFGTLRGRSLLLSPADYQLARTWFERGIPLSCVLRGIRTAYFKKLAESDDPEEEVRSLSWCRWAVQREWKEYKVIPSQSEDRESERLAEGERGGGDEIGAILDGAIFDLARAGDTSRAGGNEKMAVEFDELLGGLEEIRSTWEDGSADVEVLEEQLRNVDERMMTAAEEQLDQALRKKVSRSVKRKLRRHKDSMTKKDYDQTFRSATLARIRLELHLPKLTLYGI